MAKKKEEKTLDANVRLLARKLFESLDTPRSLTAALLLKYGEWDQLMQLNVDPSHYIDSSIGADRYLRDRQASDFLRKYPGLPAGVDTKQVAIENWLACERQCFRTNVRLDRFLGPNRVFDTPAEARIYDFIERVKKLITTVLGPVPKGLDPKFGSGAVFESPEYASSDSLTVSHKLTYTTAVTRSAEPIFRFCFSGTAWEAAYRDSDGYYRSIQPIKYVRGNRWGTVPKTAATDRNIGVEPGGNVWLQLGVGRHLRRRLRHTWGLLLPEGLSEALHRRLAMDGSKFGTYATIDLSNASDTVAYLLVKLLLPVEWFNLLDSLRSPTTRVAGLKKKIKGLPNPVKDGMYLLEKFSSMGNGFTFELETLIFAAITKVACGKDNDWDVTVYGDDIIVPNHCAPEVVSALRFFGFEPNKRKTFLSGVFRESCGGDFFLGEAVRPYTLEVEPHEPQHWISVANGLRRAASNSQLRYGLGYYRQPWLATLDNIPATVRTHRGPEELGDIVIHDRRSKWTTRSDPSTGWPQVKSWVPVGWRYDLARFEPAVQLASALLGVPSDGVAPRGAVTGYKSDWIDYVGYGIDWVPTQKSRHPGRPGGFHGPLIPNAIFGGGAMGRTSA